jgi:hypothetical protein
MDYMPVLAHPVVLSAFIQLINIARKEPIGIVASRATKPPSPKLIVLFVEDGMRP